MQGLSAGGHCYVGGSITSDVLWAGDFSHSWLFAKSIHTCPSHGLDSRTIHATVRASVNEYNDYPLTMLLADVFATEIYEADGMPSRQTLFAWLDEGKDVFATPGQADTPLALEDFKA